MTGLRPIGVTCKAPRLHPAGHGSPMTLTYRYISDVGGVCETVSPEECRVRSRFFAYGEQYNRSLIAHPRFPYADLCRPLRRGEYIGPGFGGVDPVAFDDPTATLTETPRTLHEAARRGTIGSLRRLVEARRREVDRADDFGLTPLAWAVIRRRREAVDLLLSAGADPLGEACDLRYEAAPLRAALILGQTETVGRMLTPAVRARVTPWPDVLVEAAVEGGQADLVALMLENPARSVQADRLIYAARQQPDRRTREVVKRFAAGKTSADRPRAGT